MNRFAAVLDHVALAVDKADECSEFLEKHLRAEPFDGGEAPGFRFHQWQFGNGMRVELLEPFRTDENDFVKRFLAAGGPGPHHLTFRVDDIFQAMKAVEAAGFPILYARTSDPGWKEAFLHPRDAFGVIVQLAQYPDKHRTRDLANDDKPGKPHPGAALTRVDLDVIDLADAMDLYSTLLGGEPHRALSHRNSGMGRGTLPDDAVELSWAGTGALALCPVSPAPMGVKQGIRRLVFEGVLEDTITDNLPGCLASGRLQDGFWFAGGTSADQVSSS